MERIPAKKLWWLAVPVLLAVFLHRFLFVPFLPGHILNIAGTTQAACAVGVLSREHCERGRDYLRQTFAEVGSDAFVASEAEPFSVYARLSIGLDAYVPFVGLVFVPFNIGFARWHGALAGGLQHYQIYGWLYYNGWGFFVYGVAVWLVASALRRQWLTAIVLLNASLLLVGVLDLFYVLGYFSSASHRSMQMMLIVAGLLRRAALEEQAGAARPWDVPFWGALLVGGLFHRPGFDIIVPPLFALMVLRLGRGEPLWRRAVHSGTGLVLLVGIVEATRYWMNGELHALELARDWRGLAVDAPLYRFDRVVITGIYENLKMLNDGEYPVYFLLFSVALWVVWRARRSATAPWTRLETLSVVAVIAWLALASCFNNGTFSFGVYHPFRRALVGVALFAVLATALADRSLAPWVCSAAESKGNLSRERTEGALCALCIGWVAWWLVGFAVQLKGAKALSTWQMAASLLEAPVEGRLLRYVQIVLGLP